MMRYEVVHSLNISENITHFPNCLSGLSLVEHGYLSLSDQDMPRMAALTYEMLMYTVFGSA